ncbi:unnamed protein product [Soboliphyme baturini]|uniref:Coiled-coil domain-containing protein 160 n=1 Tax=Soboliphyme baturini TaxID=241478 RepID=A0A183IYV9_9BILA|nr:unnamed protein product [Soboliphyme baturini]
MEEISLSNDEEEIETADRDHEGVGPTTERWSPLGAPACDERHSTDNSLSEHKNSRLVQLEEEQEKLSSALLALSTHFAQVQFRLQQICKASEGEKEKLLKELEEFAFKGCPDILELKRFRQWHSNNPDNG